MNFERLIIAVDDAIGQRIRDLTALVYSRTFYSPLDMTASIAHGVDIVEYTHQILDGQRKFQIQSQGRAVSGHLRADAASQRLHRVASGRQRHHEAKAGGDSSIGIEIDTCAIHQFRSGHPVETE